MSTLFWDCSLDSVCVCMQLRNFLKAINLFGITEKKKKNCHFKASKATKQFSMGVKTLQKNRYFFYLVGYFCNVCFLMP